MTDIDTRVLSCFRAVFPSLDDEQLGSATQLELEDWDSLACLSLIAVLEEEFDIVLDDATIDELNTFAAVRDAVGEAVREAAR